MICFLGSLTGAAFSEQTPATGKGVTAEMVVYVVAPTRHLKILPNEVLIPGEISTELRLIACRGEYEPASFVIAARSDLKSLKVAASDLLCGEARIPASAVDVRAVKCWYQSMGVGFVPELLLHDDGLVKVDTEKEVNYLKLRFADGERYVSISDPAPPDPALKLPVPEGHNFSKFLALLDPEKYPVRDSAALQPVDIPAKTNKQLWITVKVPDAAADGIYAGTVSLSAEGIAPVALALKLRVLPFQLLPPYHTSAIYYSGRYDPTNRGSISAGMKSELQFRRELENLVAHGVTEYMTFSCPPYTEEQLATIFRIRREAGMTGTTLYTYGGDTTVTKPEELQALKEKTVKTLEWAKSHGFNGVYLYGLDEAKGDRLTSQRQAWQAVREAGGKVFVSGYIGSNFELMGDIQDLLICAGPPSREEAARWHSKGHKIWCYANPQAGMENPEIYRRNFGLVLWKNDYDGAATWAYQSNSGNCWSDFDTSGRGLPKDRATHEYHMAYPTVDGVVDTIQWEGYREGVDDIRYVTTLRKAIEDGKASPLAEARKAALAADSYLQGLKTGDAIDTGSVEAIRLEVIDHLLRLTAALAGGRN
jgi:hypothetical protein